MSSEQKSLFDRADKWMVRILKYISYISAVCLISIMFVAFFNVLGEKLRQAGLPVTGIPASTEIIQYLHIPMVFLAAAYVTLDRGHTSIDLLSSKFPPAVQRVCAIIGNLLGAFVSGFISWRGFVQMIKFYERNKMSSTSGVGFPLWPFALILGIGFALLAISFLWNIVRNFHGKKPPAPPGPPTEEELAENGGDQ